MRFLGYILCSVCWACGGEPVLPPPKPPPIQKQIHQTASPPEPDSVAIGRVPTWTNTAPLVQKTLAPSAQSARERLIQEYTTALKQNRKPYVMVYSNSCAPCVALRESLTTPLMMEAFRGVHLIQLDNSIWGPQLEALGMKSGSFPRIHELSDNGQASPRVITGEAWGEDIPINMAPPLKTFLRQ